MKKSFFTKTGSDLEKLAKAPLERTKRVFEVPETVLVQKQLIPKGSIVEVENIKQGGWRFFVQKP